MRDAFRLDPDGNWRSELLEQIPGLEHGFGTKSAALPYGALATVKQIHSAIVLDAGDSGGLKGEGDALISEAPGVAAGIKTADCVPVLLADPVRSVAAAVHAGWRGTVKEIAARAIAQMAENYKTNPGDVRAAIGPAIGACCYAVGPEVSREFAKWPFGADREYVDLAKVNWRQLMDAGVPESNISCANLCTKCRSDQFFSFRREAGEAGRMVSWIRFKPGLDSNQGKRPNKKGAV